MLLHKSLLAGSAMVLALAPVAAMAQDRDVSVHGESGEIGEIAERLSDPATQLAASAAVVAMTEALLQMRVEPFARAARAAGADGSLSDLPPDARVRDLAGPRAGHVQRDIARAVPKAMGATAGMAGAVEDMLPELRAAARRMKDSLPRE